MDLCPYCNQPLETVIRTERRINHAYLRCRPCKFEQEVQPSQGYQLKLLGAGKRRVAPPCPSEVAEQELFFTLVRRYEMRFPILARVIAIPNGAWLSHPGEGRKLLRTGLKPGVSDTFCPLGFTRDGRLYRGWWGELKRLRGPGPRAEQIEWLAAMNDEGYWARWHRGGWAMWMDYCACYGIALDEQKLPLIE